MNFTRRDFLKWSAVGAAGIASLAVAGCAGDSSGGQSSGGQSSGGQSSGGQSSGGQSSGGQSSGGTGTEAAQGKAYGEIDFNEEPYNILVNFAVTGDPQPDLKMIEEKANEILLPAINATVTLETFSISTIANFYTLKAAGQEKMDLMLLIPGSRFMPNYANSNMIQPIDEVYEEYGQSIIAAVGQNGDAGKFNGKQYCVISKPKLVKNRPGINMAYEILTRNGFDINEIHNWDDVEKVFETVHKNEPDITCLGADASSSLARSIMPARDNYMAGTQFLWIDVKEDGSLIVECPYETEAYMDACKRVRRWYEAGYISRDVLTTQVSGRDLQFSGAGFSYMFSSTPSKGQLTPVHGVAALMDDDQYYLYTSDLQTYIWGIAQSCKRPDKCMQFLNVLYESPELVNLFKWGVEGVHYEVVADGIFRWINQEGYRNSFDVFGDASFQLLREDITEAFRPGCTAAEYWAAYKEWDDSTPRSATFGFAFDPAPVKTEVAACDNVYSEYNCAIGCGTVDPEVEVPKYVKKLYDAGMQKVMDELQSQLDAWVAANK